jgi:hypothetical protein
MKKAPTSCWGFFRICVLGSTPVIPHDPDARTYYFCLMFWNVLFLNEFRIRKLTQLEYGTLPLISVRFGLQRIEKIKQRECLGCLPSIFIEFLYLS